MENLNSINRSSIQFSLFVGIILSSGALLADNKPDWVEGSAGFYPNDKFLTATGSADRLELAKDRALGNLSKIFEVQIRESSTTRSDTSVNVKDGVESYTKKQHVAQQIQLDTDKIINGARVAETWKDESVFTYHALSVLDRAQAGNNIKSELTRLDEETQRLISRSQSATDGLLEMSALNQAVNLQNERHSLQNMLKVIDLSGTGVEAKWSLVDLNGQLDNKLQTLEIGTVIDSDPIGKLDQIVKSAMANSGFPAGNGTSEYTLVTSLDVQDLGFRQGWYWLRGKLSIKMIESNGKIRGRKQWLLKVSALQHNDAESRLMTQASKKLNKDIKLAILKFATSKTEK